jgi:hypothetical protein
MLDRIEAFVARLPGWVLVAGALLAAGANLAAEHWLLRGVRLESLVLGGALVVLGSISLLLERSSGPSARSGFGHALGWLALSATLLTPFATRDYAPDGLRLALALAVFLTVLFVDERGSRRRRGASTLAGALLAVQIVAIPRQGYVPVEATGFEEVLERVCRETPPDATVILAAPDQHAQFEAYRRLMPRRVTTEGEAASLTARDAYVLCLGVAPEDSAVLANAVIEWVDPASSTRLLRRRR